MQMIFDCDPTEGDKHYEPREFYIPDILPRRGVVLVVGAGGSFKTSLVLHWLYSIRGDPYERGDNCKPAIWSVHAAILAREAHDQTREAWQSYQRAGKAESRWEGDTYICGNHVRLTAPDAFDITNPDDVDEWLGYVKDYDADIREGLVNGSQHLVFVVDSLSTCLVGHDENAAGTMSKACAGLKRLSTHPAHGYTAPENDALVIAIHHPTKGGRDPRGNGALIADIDFVLNVSAKAGVVTVECTRARGATKGRKLRYQTRVETVKELVMTGGDTRVVEYRRIEFDELPPTTTPKAPAEAPEPATAGAASMPAPTTTPAHPADRLRGRAAACWAALALPAGASVSMEEARAICTRSAAFADVPGARTSDRWREVVAAFTNKGLIDESAGWVRNPTS